MSDSDFASAVYQPLSKKHLSSSIASLARAAFYRQTLLQTRDRILYGLAAKVRS